MYTLNEMPTDLNKQGKPMTPPPAWLGPGINWDIPVEVQKPLGSFDRRALKLNSGQEGVPLWKLYDPRSKGMPSKLRYELSGAGPGRSSCILPLVILGVVGLLLMHK